MSTVKPGTTTYSSTDPIKAIHRQIAAGFQQAYRNARSTEARTAVHRSAWQVALHVWPEATGANNTLHRRFLDLCFGNAAEPPPAPPAPSSTDLNVIVGRLKRAGELAGKINDAARAAS